MLIMLIALAAQVTPVAATTNTAPVNPSTRYCAENISDGTPYPRTVCKTRAEWMKGPFGVDPLEVARTTKQRPLRTRVR